MKRTITQIACTDNRIFALANDGSLWEMNHGSDGWQPHGDLPGAPDLERVITLSSDPSSIETAIKLIDHHILVSGDGNVGSLRSAMSILRGEQ